MNKNQPLQDNEREELLESLHQQYCGSRSSWRRWTYTRKKYAWIVVVQSSYFIKRLLDIAVSFSLLILLFPLFLLVSLAIKLTDGGPVLYLSKRVGKWGHPFVFPKFRSMVQNADRIKEVLAAQNQHGQEGVTFKMKKDPRITWIGRLIRRTSIDELPQLFCVLIGTMSLVGPRPPLIEEVQRYTQEQRRRLDITPGITCIWQVSGRSELSFPEQVLLDKQYIESQSLWEDFKILLKTIPAVVLGKGAY